MSKKGSYIGGHTLLKQRPGDFEAELERKAIRARKLAAKDQVSFDKKRSRKVAKIKALHHAWEQAAAERRAERRAEKAGQSPDKIRRAPRSDFLVLKVARKSRSK
jgi:hypothetical protein